MSGSSMGVGPGVFGLWKPWMPGDAVVIAGCNVFCHACPEADGDAEY